MTSNVPAFTAGELVDVRIRGARVTDPQPATHGEALYLTVGAHHFAVPTASASVTIERVAPAEWPPRTGDVWTDANSHEWIAVEFDGAIKMRTVDDDRGGSISADYFMANYGPVGLERRRGWTPATETTPAAALEPEKLDKRAEVAAGLRAWADLLEDRPDLAVGYLSNIGPLVDSLQEVQAWADALGTEVRQSTAGALPGTVHHRVSAKLRGLHLNVACIEDLPADTRMTLDEALADAFPEDLVDDGDPGPVDGCPSEDCDDLVIVRALAAGECMWRYTSRDDAVLGHAVAVELVRAGGEPPEVLP